MRNQLIIWHYELYLPTFTYTIYSIPDGSQKVVSFPEYEKMRQVEHVLPPFLFFGKHYYFLFEDKIVEYDPDNEQKTEYDLTEFDLSGPMGLLVNE